MTGNRDDAATDGGVAADAGETETRTREIDIPEGQAVTVSVPPSVDVDEDAVVPSGDKVTTVTGQSAGDDAMAITPTAAERTADLGGIFNDLYNEFDRIQDDKIKKLRDNRVQYNDLVGKWLIQADDRIPAVLNHQVGLVMGQEGLTVDPADPDSDADQRLADHLSSVYAGESDTEDHVKPGNVVRRIFAQNYMAARAVLRSIDLAELPLESLTFYRDPEDGTEYYLQEAVTYTKLEFERDENGLGTDWESKRATANEHVLEIGKHVFDAKLFNRVPLKAIADLVVNKLVLQRLKARRAEIQSVGGLYIKVEPPDWLPESEYSDMVPDPDKDDESVKKLELVMREEISNAFSTLEGYQSGFIMSIPAHWTVEQIEVPGDLDLNEDIRRYNQDIAARLMFPLDLMELREGAELSRDTLMKTLLNTIAGWRQEILEVFEDFASVQKDIHGISGEVNHSFPKLESEDEELLVTALNMAGIAGISTDEARQILNSIEGIDLEPRDEPESDGLPDEPGGPEAPEERTESMRDAMDTFSPDPSADSDSDMEPAPAAAQTEKFTPPEGLDLHELDGWDQSSVWKAFLSLGGRHTTCSKRMATEVRNADAWCAALKDQALGTDLWRSGAGADPDDLTGTVPGHAQDPKTIEFEGSLSEFAAAVEAILEDNTDADVTELNREDDYVAFSLGGVDPREDEDGDFQPVVVIDSGEESYSVQGASDDDLSGLADRVAATATASHAFSGFDNVRQAAQHVRDLLSDHADTGHTTDMVKREQGGYKVFQRDNSGDFVRSLIVTATPDDAEDYMVIGGDALFRTRRSGVNPSELARDGVNE